MFKKLLFATILSSSVVLSGCSYEPTRQDAGMVIGGTLGGLLGSQVDGDGRTAAIIAGTLIGAAVGGAIGRSMDETDRLKTAHALEATRTGVPSSWRNPDTGYQYTVTPTRTYDTAGAPCRDYTVDAIIDGRREMVTGTACRQPDGSWRAS